MTIEVALVAELSKIAGLAGKVHPLNAPESEVPPYLVYAKRSGQDRKTLGGYDTGQKFDTIYLDVYQSSYKNMKALAKTVTDTLKGFNDSDIGDGSVHVQEVTVNDTIELFESAVYLYRAAIELDVYYN